MINKIALILLSTCLPCSCFAGTLLERTFQHGDITRQYDIYLPDGLAKNAPLVFVLHGRTSKKKWIRNHSQMNDVADKGGFAVCYPQGTSAVMPGLDEKPVPHWNVHLTYMDVDDVGFLSDLALFLHREYKLNPERTFVAGHSNGAHMAYALGVERPDVFKGVASVAGWMSYDAWKRRKDAKPIPVIQIHGLADPVNPIEGYGGNPDRRGLGWGGALHVDDVIKFWVELNGCKNKETEVLTPRTTVDRYTDGKNNMEVWYYKIAGWPHIWPANGHNPESVSKEGVINASEEIWKFFSQFPLSPSRRGTRQEFQQPDTDPSPTPKASNSSTAASIEKKTRIHRLATTKRSTFDAFSYVNRIPEKPYDAEAPDDFAGRIFSRLANQEGRILLKVPAGMDRPAYEGFKTFLRYEGTASVGNCAACHTLPDFRDGKSHIVSKAGEGELTPSLRNSISRGVDLKKALESKLDALRRKKSGEADGISDEYSTMQLSAEDVSNLIAFLKLLDDVSDERFRQLILEASVLDTLSD